MRSVYHSFMDLNQTEMNMECEEELECSLMNNFFLVKTILHYFEVPRNYVIARDGIENRERKTLMDQTFPEEKGQVPNIGSKSYEPFTYY